MADTVLCLFNPKRFKDSVYWIRIKTRLKFGEQFARYRRNIHDARHWQQEPFGPRIKRDLETFCQIANLNYGPAQTHVAHDRHLRLDGFAQRG